MRQKLLGIVILTTIAVSCNVFSFEVPLHDQYVTDMAGVLSPGQEEDLEVSMYKIRQNHDIEGAILLVSTLSGEVIENASLQVAEERGVGDGEKDNGFIIFAAIDDRDIRMEVGYGLEYLLTDGVSKRILDNNIAPHFREGDYAGGLQAVLDDVTKVLSGDVEIASFDTQELDYASYGNSEEQYAIIMIFSFIFFIIGLGLILEFVVIDPSYNAKKKAQADIDGKKKPYITKKGWRNFFIMFVIYTILLVIFSASIVGSLIGVSISLFLALWICLQEGLSGGSSGSGSSSSSSWSSSKSSRSSSSSSSSWSSGSSFGGFSGGSFGGGGSSSSR